MPQNDPAGFTAAPAPLGTPIPSVVIAPTVASPPLRPTPPLPSDRFLWITTLRGLYAVNETSLAVSSVSAPRGTRFVSVTSLFTAPGIERVYATIVATGEGGAPSTIPTFDPISLAETDFFDPSYPAQFYIRALGNKLWKTKNDITNGWAQQLDLTGAVLSNIDLNTVPAAPVAHRVPYAFDVDGTKLHVLTRIGAAGHLFVEVDSAGLATTRESSGTSMLSSAGEIVAGGQVARLAGSLWIGDGHDFPGPPPPPSNLYATDIATYVTTQIPLSISLGLWTGTMTTNGSKLFAGFRDPLFVFTVGRIAPDGTVEAVWNDGTTMALDAAFFDDGFLWVVAGFPAFFFSVDFNLVKIDPATMLEVSRTLLFNALAIFGGINPAPDIAVTVHGPP